MIWLILSVYTPFLDNTIDKIRLLILNKFPRLAKIIKISKKFRIKKNFEIICKAMLKKHKSLKK